MRRGFAAALALLACMASADCFCSRAAAETVKLENYFRTLKRPDSPNTWLVAPADFVTKPDAVAPLFDVPVSRLREAFMSVVTRAEGATVVAESADGMHIVVTTRLLKFKDDVRVLFIPVGERQSTMALYSASRVGYWDFGTNRRRIDEWVEETQAALGGGKS